MTKAIRIKDLLATTTANDKVIAEGWVRTRRDSKTFSFLEINDGSCMANLQVVADANLPGYDEIQHIPTGAAVRVHGALVESPGAGQRWELHATVVELLGGADADYPLQKKRHTDEFLRTIAHLRVRTNKYGAVARLRSRLSFAVHDFFQRRGFHYVHTPIITGSDCEGAGEMFNVTTLDLNHVPRSDGAVDYQQDFFGKPARLTVSGQLALETYCLGLGKVYCFGPTFRSENSNTSRHMAEFWMIEPEVAFADLAADMDLAQDMVSELTAFALADCAEDLALFSKFVDRTLPARLERIAAGNFQRISYTDAITELQRSGRDFEYKPQWGHDLQTEHERFLCEDLFSCPVFVHDWPAEIKAFYMRMNDDERTVAAMDLLVPGSGELIGGSQREDRLDVLRTRMAAQGLNEADYWWYLDTRRYGSVPHAGFGLGFERLLMLLTGIGNIRDVIPFPRTPKNLEF
ncbi:MAG: asparagine--tRNA ligase [Gammaproteobacteria bacterium]|nr:asparagine--tRNA ligase [Gammaproteobacteria bacterium]